MKHYVYLFNADALSERYYTLEEVEALSEKECEDALKNDPCNVKKLTDDEFFMQLNRECVPVETSFFKMVHHEETEGELFDEVLGRMGSRDTVIFKTDDDIKDAIGGDIDVYIGDGKTEEFVVERIDKADEGRSFSISGIIWGDGEPCEFQAYELDSDNLKGIIELFK